MANVEWICCEGLNIPPFWLAGSISLFGQILGGVRWKTMSFEALDGLAGANLTVDISLGPVTCIFSDEQSRTGRLDYHYHQKK
jgi:hypothetical protein